MKKRILVLNYEFPPLGGGAANAIKYMLKEFSNYDNLEIDLVTSSINKFRVEEFSSNITIHYLDIGKNHKGIHYQSNKNLLIYSWKAFWYSRKLIKQKGHTLTHAFFGIPCGFIAYCLRLPYIVSLRGADVPFYSKRYYWLDLLFFRNLSFFIWKFSKHTIANSKGLRKLAYESLRSKKIDVIYNGVDVEEFEPKKKYSKKLKIIGVGRLIERKGFDLLIKSLQGLNVELTLVGTGPMKKRWEKLANDLNVKVKFLGNIHHDEIPQIYRKHNLFVLPSSNEGMSNTLLEAIASGLGVIVTDVGGSSELVKANGYIIKVGDLKVLRKSIQKYIEDSNLIELHGKKSREIAEKMSWSHVAKQYFNKY